MKISQKSIDFRYIYEKTLFKYSVFMNLQKIEKCVIIIS